MIMIEKELTALGGVQLCMGEASDYYSSSTLTFECACILAHSRQASKRSDRLRTNGDLSCDYEY
jgi:hypothetical protein